MLYLDSEGGIFFSYALCKNVEIISKEKKNAFL